MAIRRTTQVREVRPLGYCKLYREHLERIASACAELGPIKIDIDGHVEATEAADFTEVGKVYRITILTDLGESPSEFTVVLEKSAAHVEMTEPTTAMYGICSRIQDICREQRRALAIPEGAWPGAGVLVIGPCALSSILIFGSAEPALKWSLAPGIILAGFLTYTIMWLKATRNGGSAHLINTYEVDSPTFFQRTRDDWIVGAIWAAVGALAGGVIGYFVNEWS
ncbi:hypothetical protein GCM10009733_005580 [Nonomuraea maheshkhaliensis]|uniref:Uncharacterized protein n=1 Tax=Nonomuraea maheshkhaliensis TaxID=419590 RepID=A0ABN2END6_9ACTN